uniref:Uncharacterized protein n=1 Tax=Anguilla anguilla TaxID=7936 RepID=A0A0E9XLZ9_ANGAN
MSFSLCLLDPPVLFLHTPSLPSLYHCSGSLNCISLLFSYITPSALMFTAEEIGSLESS